MPLTANDAANQISSFLTAIKNNVANDVTNKTLPLIGKLSDLPGSGAAAWRRC